MAKWDHPIWQSPDAAYDILCGPANWTERDQFGHRYSDVDPVAALKAAKMPAAVIEAIEYAVQRGCKVVHMDHSCHVGGSSGVAVYEPVPDDVRAKLDAIDASGIKDAAFKNPRWYDERFDVRGASWQWIIESG